MMHTVKITIESLPYAHRLHGYAGRCSRIHGHNARIETVFASDSLDAQGFVADFYDLRRIVRGVVDEFDHSLVVCESDPIRKALADASEHHVTIATPPTAEHLAAHVLACVRRSLAVTLRAGDTLRCVSVAWQEEPGFVAIAGDYTGGSFER